MEGTSSSFGPVDGLGSNVCLLVTAMFTYICCPLVSDDSRRKSLLSVVQVYSLTLGTADGAQPAGSGSRALDE